MKDKDKKDILLKLSKGEREREIGKNANFQLMKAIVTIAIVHSND